MPHSPQPPKLVQALKPVRRRLAAVRLVRRAAAGLLAGSCAGILLLAAARFLPVAAAPVIAAALAVLGLATGAAAAVRPRIDDRAAAREMDRAGTDDAIVTALDMLHLDSPVARLQRAEAEAAAARFAAGLNERIPWPRGRERLRYMSGLAVVWLAAAILLLAPNPMDERLAAREALNGEIGRIERALDELELSGLSEEQRKALTEPLERLREQALRTEPDALRAEWEAAEREIARLAAELRQEQQALRAWAQELQRTPELGELGRALERGDRRGAAEAAERLGSLFARLSPEQREALAERLRELADGAPEDAAREAMERAADALESGESEAASEAIEQMLDGALSAEELRELAEQAATALASAGSRLGLDPAGTPGNSGWNGVADNRADGDGEGSGAADGGGRSGAQGAPSGGAGQGQTGGSGQGGSSSGGSGGSGAEGSGGRGAGSGNGAGSGGGGGTAGGGTGGGTGSGSGSGTGSGSGSGTGSGSGSGTGVSGGAGGGAGPGSGGRNLVTTPRIYEGKGETTTDGGPATGGTVTEGGSSPVFDGGARHYEEVYATYEADARRALSGGTLPPSLKERVKNYFDEIQPDR